MAEARVLLTKQSVVRVKMVVNKREGGVSGAESESSFDGSLSHIQNTSKTTWNLYYSSSLHALHIL